MKKFILALSLSAAIYSPNASAITLFALLTGGGGIAPCIADCGDTFENIISVLLIPVFVLEENQVPSVSAKYNGLSGTEEACLAEGNSILKDNVNVELGVSGEQWHSPKFDKVGAIDNALSHQGVRLPGCYKEFLTEIMN